MNAEDIGLSDGDSLFSYRVEACTGTFSGDVPGFICDHAGDIDSDTGTYDLVFDAAAPALSIDPLTARASGEVLTARHARARSTRLGGNRRRSVDPGLFPNDRPHRSPTVVETTT